MSVRVRQIVEVDFLRQTPEVSGERGWAEGAIEHVQVQRYDGGVHGVGGVLLTLNKETYLVRGPVVEAIYDVHQGEPLDGAEVVFS